MEVFILLLSVIGLAASTAEWNLWKVEHGKEYSSEDEELERHAVWLSNMKYIQQHNANSDIHGFTLAMNEFGDMVRIGVIRCREFTIRMLI